MDTPREAEMTQVRDDLWETTEFSPFPGLRTHAYLWVPADGPNVLFYAPGDESDFDRIEALGGVDHQYLSHQDEAGPALELVARRFGAALHAPAAERDAIARHAVPDVLLDRRHVDANGVEVIPTPGHSPGSTCYLVHGAGGESYLFTGDTLLRGDDGRWFAGDIPGYSDPEGLARSLALLARLRPDVVLSSAFAGDRGAHEVTADAWAEAVEQATEGLRAPIARG